MNRLFARAAAVLFALSAFLAPFSAFAAAGATVDLTVRAQGYYTGANDLGTPTFPFDVRKLTQVAAGTGTGYADKIFSDTRTIAASSTENLDLAGVLTDPFGATITCVKVKWLMFVAAAANTNSVVVGGAGSNTFVGPFADATDKISIPPGGVWMITHPGAGWTVTAATGDILLVANSSSGSGVTYDVLIGCASA